MKTLARNVVLFSCKLGSKLRIVMFIVTLVVFVLAAGAPMCTGSVGG